METPSEDNREKGYLLPPGCKDLLEVIKLPKAPETGPAAYPPVTRRITLPNVVAVRFLVETSGQDVEEILKLMYKLRIIVDVNRSVDFGAAQKILRHFGIWAERGVMSA